MIRERMGKDWKPASNKPDKDKDHQRTLKVMKWLDGGWDVSRFCSNLWTRIRNLVGVYLRGELRLGIFDSRLRSLIDCDSSRPNSDHARNHREAKKR